MCVTVGTIDTARHKVNADASALLLLSVSVYNNVITRKYNVNVTGDSSYIRQCSRGIQGMYLYNILQLLLL
jgi:hypothetical protein